MRCDQAKKMKLKLTMDKISEKNTNIKNMRLAKHYIY